MKTDYNILGLFFQLTCYACPEQYDVYFEDKQVGYVRLRGNRLYCTCPDVMGKQVYHVNFSDDSDIYKGEFDTEEERIYHLTEIAKAINNESLY
jgi:hypothetical protein